MLSETLVGMSIISGKAWKYLQSMYCIMIEWIQWSSLQNMAIAQTNRFIILIILVIYIRQSNEIHTLVI